MSRTVADVRWVIRAEKKWQGETRGGSPVYGGRSREVTVDVKTLQIMVDGKWYDVPEVRELAEARNGKV